MKRRPQVVQRFGRHSKRCLRRSGLGVLNEDEENFTYVEVVVLSIVVCILLTGGGKTDPTLHGADVAGSKPEARSWAISGFSAGGGGGRCD